MKITSVPHLLAVAFGAECVGNHRCFYCGAAANERYSVKTYVKDSFTGRSGVTAPGSQWVCHGCTLCLREDAEIILIGGELRGGQMMRGYSWFITATEVQAGTKANLDVFCNLCLGPPAPPFALVLSDSGQTHQLYRGVVCHSRELITVTLEAERINFHPEQLRDALEIAGKIAAATGKPALREPIGFGAAARILGRYPDGGESLISAWTKVGESPLGRLAAWLCPRKDVCELEYPSNNPIVDPLGHGGVPPQVGGTGGPNGKRGRDQQGGDKGARQPLLFDLGRTVL
jgi:CRISPR type IV-associated protein Csf1